MTISLSDEILEATNAWDGLLRRSYERHTQLKRLLANMESTPRKNTPLMEELDVRSTLMDETLHEYITACTKMIADESMPLDIIMDYIEEADIHLATLQTIDEVVNTLDYYYHNILAVQDLNDINVSIIEGFQRKEPRAPNIHRLQRLTNMVRGIQMAYNGGNADLTDASIASLLRDLIPTSNGPFTLVNSVNSLWWKSAIEAYLEK